jgi:hypothetical protein
LTLPQCNASAIGNFRLSVGNFRHLLSGQGVVSTSIMSARQKTFLELALEHSCDENERLKSRLQAIEATPGVAAILASERRASILALPEAKGRERQAEHLADKTQLAVEDARVILGLAPRSADAESAALAETIVKAHRANKRR